MRRRATAAAAALLVGLAAPGAAGAAVRYTVHVGDTLSGIAARNGTSVAALARANGLDPAGILLAGSTIVIPSGGAGAAPAGYTVRWGDTLSAIAARNGTSVAALARANHLDPAGILVAGTRLTIPGGGGGGGGGSPSSYVVRRGDTLSAIAARYGTSVAALARANGLDPSGILPVGRRLVLPAAGAAVAASVTAPWSVGVAIDRWSLHYGVDPHLARALAWMESGWQEDAVSSAGARGIMQVTPETWRYVERILIGVPVAHTADGNIRIGVAYLHHLLNEFGGDERLALAAYYQGASAVRRYGLLPQSRAYVADVLAIRQRM